jgi:putative membrane protein
MAVLFAIAVVLGLKNQQMVNVNYVIAQTDLRLSSLMAFTFLLGIASSSVVALGFYLKSKVQHRRLKKKNNKQRKELNKLRAELSEKE